MWQSSKFFNRTGGGHGISLAVIVMCGIVSEPLVKVSTVAVTSILRVLGRDSLRKG
jgi:hypothetical protein